MSGLTVHDPTLPSAILNASNVTHVPAFVFAGMYQSGFTGDPLSLGTTLEHWYNATGATSWPNALAAYHANSVQGVNDPHAQSYAKSVLLAAQNAPNNLAGTFAPAQALTLAGAEILGGVLATAGAVSGAGAAADAAAAAATADAAATGAGSTAATAGAGGAAGAAAKGALQAAGGAAAKKGLAALLGAGAWAEFGVRALEAMVGAALVLLGLQALTGGSGNPVDAVKSAAKHMR